MAKAGRKRLPTEQLRLHGTLVGKTAEIRRGEPQVDGEPGRCDELTGEAAAYWDEYVPVLISSGIAKTTDGPALRAMCQWWAEYLKHYNTQNDDYRRTNMMACAHKQWMALASRFGMTPSDRASLSVGDKKQHDPAADFVA